jgi:hypothetical protein
MTGLGIMDLVRWLCLELQLLAWFTTGLPGAAVLLFPRAPDGPDKSRSAASPLPCLCCDYLHVTEHEGHCTTVLV